MKTLIISAVALMFSVTASAQIEQPNDDQRQQQPPRPTQQQVERSATNATTNPNVIRNRSASEVEAEKASKERGQSQKQTKAQPNGLPPNLTDTINPPKHPDRIIPAKE